MKYFVFLLLGCFLLFCDFATGQDLLNIPGIDAKNTIKKGTKELFGNITGSVYTNGSVNTVEVRLSPGYGAFITDRLLLSGSLDLYTEQFWDQTEKTGTYIYGANAGIGYYFGVVGHSAWDVSANLGCNRLNHFFNKINQYNTTNLSGTLNLGYNYFMTQYLALNFSLFYMRRYDVENEITPPSFTAISANNGTGGFSIGLSWFIPKGNSK